MGIRVRPLPLPLPVPPPNSSRPPPRGRKGPRVPRPDRRRPKPKIKMPFLLLLPLPLLPSHRRVIKRGQITVTQAGTRDFSTTGECGGGAQRESGGGARARARSSSGPSSSVEQTDNDFTPPLSLPSFAGKARGKRGSNGSRSDSTFFQTAFR